MRAIRRDRISSAAQRSARARRAVPRPGEALPEETPGGSSGSKKARFSCTTAPLLWRCRPRLIGRGERRRGGATEANRQGCPEHASRCWLPNPRARHHNDPPPNQSTGPGSARLPSGRQASTNRTPRRRILPMTASAQPSKGWRSRVMFYRIGKIPAMGSLSPLLRPGQSRQLDGARRHAGDR